MTNRFRIAARLIIVNDNDEVLIVKMWKQWAIPGGWLDYGEKISDCLNRESLEELWVEAVFDKIIFLQDYIWKVKWKERHCLEYFCTVKNNSDFLDVETQYKKASHAFELQKVQFTKLENFPEKFMPKALPEVLKRYITNKENFSCEYVSGLWAMRK